MKLTERVYLVGSGRSGISLTDDCDSHVYLLDGGDEAALIDAGGGRDVPAIKRIIEADGIPLERVRYLLLTHGHADHSAGAAEWRESLGLQVMAARSIADVIRRGDERGISLDIARQAGIYPPDFRFPACPVDVELEEGQRIAVGDCELTVLEVPGHAADHLAFVMDRDGTQHLFSGDTLYFGGTLSLLNTPDCDLQAYIRTIMRLATLSVDVFLPGHQCFSLKDGQRHIDAAVAALDALQVPTG